jgi:hypothetical protein
MVTGVRLVIAQIEAHYPNFHGLNLQALPTLSSLESKIQYPKSKLELAAKFQRHHHKSQDKNSSQNPYGNRGLMGFALKGFD